PDRPERPLRLALGAPRAMAEADAVLRDREHPRLDRRIAAEAVAAAPGFEQRLLHEVLDIGPGRSRRGGDEPEDAGIHLVEERSRVGGKAQGHRPEHVSW